MARINFPSFKRKQARVVNDAKAQQRKAQKAQEKMVVKFASKNKVSTALLNKNGVPIELHEPVRIVASKINGKPIPIIGSAGKFTTKWTNRGIVVVSGVAAMQVPQLVREYNKNKDMLARYGTKYEFKDFVQKDLKNYDVSIAIPSKPTPEAVKTYFGPAGPGGAAISGMVVAGITLALINSRIRNAINMRRARKAINANKS